MSPPEDDLGLYVQGHWNVNQEGVEGGRYLNIWLLDLFLGGWKIGILDGIKW